MEEGGGVSRFDGQTWTTYTTDDGLADNSVESIAVASDGVLWFGTEKGGVSCFDGETWTTYTADDGLVDNEVSTIAVAPDGALWFGTYGIASQDPRFSARLGPEEGGVSRFDGTTWTTYTADDGLAGNWVSAITVAPDGALWFGSADVWPGTQQRGGVSRFDGETWTTYTEDDGLAAGYSVASIAVALDGALWVGTWGGASRFDGETWTTYTTDDGLGGGWVNSIAVAPDGALWFGTTSGVSRYLPSK